MMKRKILLSMVTVLGLILLLTTGAFALTIDFASTGGDGLLNFSGGNFSFAPASDGSDFTITHSLPSDTLHAFTGTIGGSYAIGAIGAGGLGEIAPVTLASSAGTNVFTINDGATPFTASAEWKNISTTTNGVVGGLNINAEINLTDFSYAGANPELLALIAIGKASETITWQFAAPGNDLLALASAANVVTSYSGSINASPVPVPPAALLFGTGLLGLVGFRFRRNRA